MYNNYEVKYEVMRLEMCTSCMQPSALTSMMVFVARRGRAAALRSRTVHPADVDAVDALHVLAHGERRACVDAIEVERPLREQRRPVRRVGR